MLNNKVKAFVISSFVPFFFLSASVASADVTGSLFPVSDGVYTQWTPNSGSLHYDRVDESTCDGNSTYNSETTLNQRDSYGVDLTSIPNGSTITSIEITPCASKNSSGGSNSTGKVFYRLNGVDSADSTGYSLSGTTPVGLSATIYTGLSTIKSSSTTLESGFVYTAGTKGARLSRLATVITYTPLVSPSSLSASTVSASQIDLSWTDNATNEDGFKIERSPNGTNSWVEVGSNSVDDVTFSDTGLTASTTYFYRVYAYNNGGSSSVSNTANSTTLATPPLAPTNLVATAASQTKINLTWTDNATTETGYKIEQSPNGVDSWSIVVNRGPNAISQTIFNLTPNTTYYYRVYATNSGGQSDYSNVASAITPSGLASVVTDDATNIGTNSAILNSTVNPNLGSTTVSYRYGTDELACDMLPSVTSSTSIGEGSSNISPIARTVTQLAGLTTFYFCAVATNPSGTVYGSVKSFTTL